MINVIICDDNEKDLNIEENIVKEFMHKNELMYNIHSYNDYNGDFNKIIEEKVPFKIYLLDIETPSGSGIDIARKIRKKDLDSVIIFLTVHEELGNIVLKNDLLFLSFINKFDNVESRLKDVLAKAIKLLNQKQILRFNDMSTVYTIKLDDILYITKESFERKTIIKTDYTAYSVSIALSNIKEMLDDRFIQTHRSCLVNKNRTSKIDRQNRVITFDNGETIDLLSDKYKKEMM